MDKFWEFILQKKIIGPVIVLIVGLAFTYIIKNIVKRLFIKGKNTFEQKKRATVVQLTTNVLKFFIYGIMLIIILEIYGVDTRSMIASLGIAGVVLGLALQETVKDFISGLSIIVDSYFVVGEMVTINGVTGEVIEMNIKSTKIKKYTGEVLVISNRNINQVINLSQMRAGIKIEVPTDYDEEVEHVEDTLRKVVTEAKKIPNVYQDSTYLGIEDFKDSSINYSIMIYCKQDEQWEIRRKVLRMIKLAYEEANIKIPYSQIEVHNGKKII